MNTKKILRSTCSTFALGLSLVACGGGGGGSDKPNSPPTVVQTSQEDKFGIKFGMAFRADPNGEPVPVNDGDLVPVSLTTEPIDIFP